MSIGDGVINEDNIIKYTEDITNLDNCHNVAGAYDYYLDFRECDLSNVVSAKNAFKMIRTICLGNFNPTGINPNNFVNIILEGSSVSTIACSLACKQYFIQNADIINLPDKFRNDDNYIIAE